MASPSSTDSPPPSPHNDDDNDTATSNTSTTNTSPSRPPPPPQSLSEALSSYYSPSKTNNSTPGDESAALTNASSVSGGGQGGEAVSLVYAGDWIEASVGGLSLVPPDEDHSAVLLRGQGDSSTSLVSLSLSRVDEKEKEVGDDQPLHDGDVVVVALGGGLLGWVCEGEEGQVNWAAPSLPPPSSPSQGEEGENDEAQQGSPATTTISDTLTTFVVEVVSGGRDNNLGIGSAIRLRVGPDHYLGVSLSSSTLQESDSSTTTSTPSSPPTSSHSHGGKSALVVVTGADAAALFMVDSLLYTARSPVRPFYCYTCIYRGLYSVRMEHSLRRIVQGD